VPLFVTAAPNLFAFLRDSKIEPRTGHQKVRTSNRRFLFFGVGRVKESRCIRSVKSWISQSRELEEYWLRDS